LFSFYILLRIAFGVRSTIPNSSTTVAKSRALKVAMASARPFTAVVVGIPQPGAPQEVGFDRFGDGCKRVENDLRLGNLYS
jgi:hypothetical protein